LKSNWLDGKRNRRLDHIIFTLVKSADPYYQFRHERQQAGLEGPNLEDSRREEIEEIAGKVTRDSIQKFDDFQFHVSSQTKSGHFYAVNLAPPTCCCNCLDFPRIWFCKHIGAIYHHFPHLRPRGSVPAATPVPSQSDTRPDKPEAAAKDYHSMIQDVGLLSNRLISEGANQQEPTQAAVDAVRSVKASLTAAIASAKGSTPLPPKEKIAPNQHFWTETAETMGMKKPSKRHKLPEEEGLTEKAIGAAKGKRH